jgi:hypothetical protein
VQFPCCCWGKGLHRQAAVAKPSRFRIEPRTG